MFNVNKLIKNKNNKQKYINDRKDEQMVALFLAGINKKCKTKPAKAINNQIINNHDKV